MRFPFDDRYEFEYEEDDNPYRGMSPKMMASSGDSGDVLTVVGVVLLILGILMIFA